MVAYNIKEQRYSDVLRNLLYIDCNEVNVLSDSEIHQDIFKDAKIILPIFLNEEDRFVAKEIKSHLANIFIFFPLIGSQHIWGTTFIMHSPLFTPTTERNGIFLVSEAPNVQQYQCQNRAIIEFINTIIFSFLNKFA